MPELPEVQTTVNTLNSSLRGLSISDVWTDYRSAFHEKKPNIKNSKYFPIFKKTVSGKKIISVKRRAKNVLINLSGNETILIHMKMTGHLLYGKYKRNPKLKILNPKQIQNSNIKIQNEEWKPAEKGPLNDPYNRFIHLVFALSNKKHLVLSDMRKFAKICVLKTKGLEQNENLKNLGPEPLEKGFSFKVFNERLSAKPNMKIKPALMDQTILAGIGNIYSDEMLWLAGIHPLTKIKKIKTEARKTLYKNLLSVLRKGIQFGGDSMSDYRTPSGTPGKFQLHHKAYRRTGEKCQKQGCGGIIKRIRIGGRGAHFCNKHQKLKN